MTTTLRGHVAAEVRAELARQQLTQDELADRVGVSQAWVSKRLCGHVPFDVVDIERVAGALGVPVTNFLPTPERAA